MKDEYKNWKESTSTLASNRYLGHYKFLLALVSKKLILEMEQHYSTHPDNPNFTRRGLTKQIIALVLTINVEEWYMRYKSLTYHRILTTREYHPKSVPSS